jgi:hypothetical protein
LRLFREVIKTEFENPTQEFVKYFLSKINYKKPKTEERLNKYTILLKNSLDNYIADRVNNNLRRAIAMENENVEPSMEQKLPDGVVFMEDGIITTEEEIEGYKIVKAILGVKVSADKIIYKDAKSYFVINYERVQQPICRLYLNNVKQKQIGLFNAGKYSSDRGGKIDDKYDISSLEDIYKYSQKLLDTIDLYDSGTYYKSITTENTDIQNKN